MKIRNFISVALLLLSFNSFSQGGIQSKSTKRKEMAHYFLRFTYPHLVLDTILWKEQEKVSRNIEKYFKEYGLDINNPEDYKYFQWNIDHQFKFMRKNILEQVKYKYEHKKYDELKKLTKGVKNGKGDKIIMTSLYPMIKGLVDKEIHDLNKYSVPKYLEIIKKRHQPIDLKLYYNHYKTPAEKLPLEIYVTTNNVDHLKESILDKKNQKLLQPEGYKYEQIQSIVVVYKGQEFVFKPDPKIFLLPKQLTKMKNIYSDYNFRKIPEWKLSITEDDKFITVKLSNVVDAIIRKTKQKLQLKKSLDK